MMKWVGADVSAVSKVPNDQRDDWEDWMLYDEEHPFNTTIKAENTSSSSVTHPVTPSITSQTGPKTTTSTRSK
jgi:hypothetical protein